MTKESKELQIKMVEAFMTAVSTREECFKSIMLEVMEKVYPMTFHTMDSEGQGKLISGAFTVLKACFQFIDIDDSVGNLRSAKSYLSSLQPYQFGTSEWVAIQKVKGILAEIKG